MLAKPEYFSLPDEACCWPGAMAELLLARGTVAELHREAFAGRGAAKCGKEGGALRWGPCAWGTQRWGRWAGAESLKPPVGNPARENPCWVTSVGDPARGNPCWAQVVFTSTSCADSALWCPARVQSEEFPPPVYL